ncbi:DUF6541 family protein [Corynebacterium sp. 335C]
MPASLLVLLLLLIAPGAIVSAVAGLRPAWALAAGPAVTLCVTGVAGFLLGLVDVPYGFASLGAVWLGFVAVAAAWRAAFAAGRRRRASRDDGDRAGGDPEAAGDDEAAGEAAVVTRTTGRHRAVPADAGDGAGGGRLAAAVPQLLGLAGVVTGFFLLWTPLWNRLQRVPGALESIPQAWDVHWHASVIRYIRDFGMASATRMGEIQNIETKDPMFYPAAWHALGATVGEASGISTIAVTNLMGIAVPAVTVPLAAAALAWRLVDRPGLSAGIAAGLAAVASASLPVLYPIGIAVGAWPYLVAIGLGVVCFVLVSSTPHRPERILPAGLALGGAGLTHPSALAVAAVLGVLWWLLLRLWAPVRPELGAVRSRLRDLGMLAASGGVGLLVFAPQVLLMSGTGQDEEIGTFSATVDTDRVGSWILATRMLTRHAEPLHPVWPVIIAGAAGLLVALVWRRAVWAAAAFGFFLVTVVHGLHPIGGAFAGVLDAYATMHYSTPHRLIMPVAYLYCAGAGVLLAAVLRLVTGGTVRRLAPWNGVAAVVAAVAVAGVMAPWAVQRNAEAMDYGVENRDGRAVGPEDLRAFDWLARQPETREHTIYLNPNESSGWMYARNGLPSLFRHNLWPSVPEDGFSATDMIYWHADKIGAGVEGDPWALNDIDRAVEKLNVGFLYVSPPNLWPQEPYTWPWTVGAWWAPGTTLVYKDGPVGILAVNRAIGADAIARMRAESPEPLPPLPTHEVMGVPGGDAPYVFMPGEPREGNPLVAPPPGEPGPPPTPTPPLQIGDPRLDEVLFF